MYLHLRQLVAAAEGRRSMRRHQSSCVDSIQFAPIRQPSPRRHLQICFIGWKRVRETRDALLHNFSSSPSPLIRHGVCSLEPSIFLRFHVLYPLLAHPFGAFNALPSDPGSFSLFPCCIRLHFTPIHTDIWQLHRILRRAVQHPKDHASTPLSS